MVYNSILEIYYNTKSKSDTSRITIAHILHKRLCVLWFLVILNPYRKMFLELNFLDRDKNKDVFFFHYKFCSFFERWRKFHFIISFFF